MDIFSGRSVILSPIVGYLNHGNDHLPEGQFFFIAILLILLLTYNGLTKMLLTAAFCANFEIIYLSFFNIMKTEIKNKLVVGLSFTQPSLVC